MSAGELRDRAKHLLQEASAIELSLSHLEWRWETWRSQNEKELPESLVEEQGELQTSFDAVMRALYLTTICLIETMQLPEYLKHFYRAVGNDFDSEGAAKFEPADDWPPYPQNVLLLKLRRFLSPLGIDDNWESYRQQAGTKHLESLLENTGTLVEMLKLEPESEPQVYRPMREMLKLVFDSARNPPPGRFSSSLKYYTPDILIPEILVAVEYKYIPDMATLKAAMAGIADDVLGYTGDTQYRLFYAVFYFKRSIVSRKRFLATWEEKKFPKNWVPIYVVGK